MKKVIMSLAIIAFAGLLSTSLLAILSGTSISRRYVNSPIHTPYFIGY